MFGILVGRVGKGPRPSIQRILKIWYEKFLVIVLFCMITFQLQHFRYVGVSKTLLKLTSTASFYHFKCGY